MNIKNYLSFPDVSNGNPQKNKIDHSITFVIVLFVILLFSSIQFFAQEKEEKTNSEKVKQSTIPNSTLVTGDTISVKDDAGNVLMTVTDEGTAGSIKLKDAGDISPNMNKLYNNGGNLYWNGDKLASLNSTIEYGDIKNGFQTTDHNGWLILDGRPISSLTKSQQIQATALGFVDSIPNAMGRVLMNKGNFGTVGGADSITILQSNLPSVNFSGTTEQAGNHNHSFWTANNDVNSSSSQGYPTNNNHNAFRTTDRRQMSVNNGDIQNDGNHSHTVSINSGGNDLPIGIVPSYLSVNTFIYLGE